jgi:predicted XRE-type DNA-binding protein
LIGSSRTRIPVAWKTDDAAIVTRIRLPARGRVGRARARIAEAIAARGLTQVAAARLLGVDQPKISRLVRGDLAGLSADRLLRSLTRLGRDVEIVVRPVRPDRRPGRLRVRAA